MQKRKWIIFLLVICTVMTFSQTKETAYATSAEKEKQEAQENLKDVNSQIEDLKNQQEENEAALANVKAQLENLFAQQTKLQSEIEANELQMVQTALELEAAQQEAESQYEDMKLRIQYMYENSTSDSLLAAIIESDGLIDMLKRIEYVMAVHRSDRELTRKYQESVATVEAKQKKLQQEQDELLFQQEAFLGRQLEIETMIAALTEEQSSFATRIASAEEQAKAYQETIKKQDEIIRKQKLEEEQKQASNNQTAGNTGTANSSVTGMDVVNFARQFVGNPYVWGGNSLTEGCDCSGFVHLVYKNFGYTLPRYSMSFLNAGTPVDYEDMQPGDIVVYSRNSAGIGHVAIYMGNGKIVEAQSSSTGITDYRSVNYREILGIRRIIN